MNTDKKKNSYKDSGKGSSLIDYIRNGTKDEFLLHEIKLRLARLKDPKLCLDFLQAFKDEINTVDPNNLILVDFEIQKIENNLYVKAPYYPPLLATSNLDRTIKAGYNLFYKETKKYVNDEIRKLELVVAKTDNKLFVKKGNLDPWDDLGEKAQNRITSFLTGKRKENKPCYRFLLSVFELKRNHIDNGDAQAVLDLAEEQQTYKSIDTKPDEQSQRKRIKEYMNRHNSPGK